jgi:hypothetical protein
LSFNLPLAKIAPRLRPQAKNKTAPPGDGGIVPWEIRFRWPLLAALAVLSIILFRDYFDFDRMYWHDSVVMTNSFQIFYDSFFRGHLPLWSPYINCGQPIWPQVETVPSFDPVALAVWLIFRIVNPNAAYAYQYTCLVWLFIFALGWFVLTLRVDGGLGPHFVFVVCFGGPIAVSLAAQSQGFLIPYRYVPWVLLAFLRFCRNSGWLIAIGLGMLIAISAAGYQTPYSYLFFAFFFFFYLLFTGQLKLAKLAVDRKYYLAVGLAAIIGLYPLLLAGMEMIRLFPVARTFFTAPYGPPALSELYVQITTMFTNGWHGTYYLGCFPVFVIVSVVPWIFWRWARTRRIPRLSWTPLEKTWIAVTLSMTALVYGVKCAYLNGHPTFLNLRNWGFEYPLLLLCTAQVFLVLLHRMTASLPPNNTADTGNIAPTMSLKWVGISIALVIIAVYVRRFYLPESALASLDRHLWIIYGLILLVALFRTPQVVSSIVLLLGIANILALAHVQLTFASRQIADDELRRRMPSFAVQPDYPPIYRRWEYPFLDKPPYFYEGPTVEHSYCAFMHGNVYATGLSAAFRYPVTTISHQFREPLYEDLLTSGVSIHSLSVILGSTGPIAYMANRVLFAPDESSALAQLKAPGDPPEKYRAVVEEPLDLAPAAPGDHNSVQLMTSSFRCDHVSFHVSNSAPGLFVYTDNWSPYWSAYVDGKETRIIPVNVTNKGVLLPAGDHDVSFDYFPTAYVVSFWVRAAALAAAGVVWFFLLMRLPPTSSEA